MKKYQNIAVVEQAVKSTTEVFKSQSPTANAIKKTMGMAVISSYLEILLTRFATFINVKGGLTHSQAEDIINLILCDFGYLKLPDFILFFKNLKKGLYGEFYGSFDGLKIMTALENYTIQRGRDAEGLNYNKHLNTKNDFKIQSTGKSPIAEITEQMKQQFLKS